MRQWNWKKISKIIITICIVGLLTVLSVRYLIPLCQLLCSAGGREEICRIVEGYGAFAPMIFILLMAMQIVVAFIPGGPMELIAGMLFGSVWGTVWTLCGTLLGMVCVFFLVKRFGRPLVNYFVPEEKLQKFSILQDEEKLSFLVFLLFLIPGIPKDLLTYIVPLTRMSAGHFFLLGTLARFPAILASVLVGDSLAAQNYGLCIGIAIATLVFVVIGFQIKKHIFQKRSDES